MKSSNGIVGFAIGDTLGVPVEFKSREELIQNPIINMIGYGSHKVPQSCNLYEELFNKGINIIFLKEGYINTEVYRKALEH